MSRAATREAGPRPTWRPAAEPPAPMQVWHRAGSPETPGTGPRRCRPSADRRRRAAAAAAPPARRRASTGRAARRTTRRRRRAAWTRRAARRGRPARRRRRASGRASSADMPRNRGSNSWRVTPHAYASSRSDPRALATATLRARAASPASSSRLVFPIPAGPSTHDHLPSPRDRLVERIDDGPRLGLTLVKATRHARRESMAAASRRWPTRGPLRPGRRRRRAPPPRAWRGRSPSCQDAGCRRAGSRAPRRACRSRTLARAPGRPRAARG